MHPNHHGAVECLTTARDWRVNLHGRKIAKLLLCEALCTNPRITESVLLQCHPMQAVLVSLNSQECGPFIHLCPAAIISIAASNPAITNQRMLQIAHIHARRQSIVRVGRSQSLAGIWCFNNCQARAHLQSLALKQECNVQALVCHTAIRRNRLAVSLTLVKLTSPTNVGCKETLL